jgi:hypothetical protein
VRSRIAFLGDGRTRSVPEDIGHGFDCVLFLYIRHFVSLIRLRITEEYTRRPFMIGRKEEDSPSSIPLMASKLISIPTRNLCFNSCPVSNNFSASFYRSHQSIPSSNSPKNAYRTHLLFTQQLNKVSFNPLHLSLDLLFSHLILSHSLLPTRTSNLSRISSRIPESRDVHIISMPLTLSRDFHLVRTGEWSCAL